MITKVTLEEYLRLALFNLKLTNYQLFTSIDRISVNYRIRGLLPEKICNIQINSRMYILTIYPHVVLHIKSIISKRARIIMLDRDKIIEDLSQYE